jgi:hypothetical protein
MYDNHVPTIAAAMRHDPNVFANAIMFAALSARTQFVTVPRQMAELRRRGSKATCLWSWKGATYAYVQEHKERIWREVLDATTTEDALLAITQVPGLGAVKGGFVLQMMGHDVACLDVRNIRREGLDPEAYATHGNKKGQQWRNKVQRYVAQTQGRARELWDTWCEDVAGTYALTPHKVSELHLTSIVPKALRNIAPVAPMVAQEVPF